MNPPLTRRGWWMLALAIAALALAASANSVVNNFTYDDWSVIVRAPRIHSLAGWWREMAHTYWDAEWGGDGYRPFTTIAFRLQWVFGGGEPLLFHAVNVALHVVTSVAVFWLACGFLPLAAAWVAAALYSVHPVHVEAIASVVGQSELWVALFVTLAVGLYVHGRMASALTWKRWLAIGVLYAAACLSKEHGIVLPALLVLAEATIVGDRAPLAKRLVAMRPAILALAAVGLAYVWARSRVVVGGGSGFVPAMAFQVLRVSATDRILTMIGATPEWLRLFLWPARLIMEYSPQYVAIAQGPSASQLPGLLILLGVIGLAIGCWRRSPVTSFGIGWLVVTLLPASNFVIPAGIIIAERTLLLPSAGAMIAVASAIPWLYQRFEERRVAQYVGTGAVAILIVLGLARSYTRNRVWRDNYTLFHRAVVDAPDSYKAHYVLGTYLFENKRRRDGELHYRRAIELFPLDPVVLYSLADEYRLAGKCEPAIPLFRAAFEIAYTYRAGLLELSQCLLNVLDLAESKRVALLAIRFGAPIGTAHQLIAAANAGADSLAARRARGDTSYLRGTTLSSSK
jgi:tetratricopeptide (TPR) repeat protein